MLVQSDRLLVDKRFYTIKQLVGKTCNRLLVGINISVPISVDIRYSFIPTPLAVTARSVKRYSNWSLVALTAHRNPFGVAVDWLWHGSSSDLVILRRETKNRAPCIIIRKIIIESSQKKKKNSHRKKSCSYFEKQYL